MGSTEASPLTVVEPGGAALNGCLRRQRGIHSPLTEPTRHSTRPPVRNHVTAQSMPGGSWPAALQLT